MPHISAELVLSQKQILEEIPQEASACSVLKRIEPADLIGTYEADSYLSTRDLARLCDTRLMLGEEVSRQDRELLSIPLRSLIAGRCFSVKLSPDLSKDEIDSAWEAACQKIIRQAAAEFAVRQELRAKRIGISD